MQLEYMLDNNNDVIDNILTSSFWTEKELEEGEWRHLALQRMAKIFRTHVIKFDLDDNFINKGK